MQQYCPVNYIMTVITVVKNEMVKPVQSLEVQNNCDI